MYLHLLYFSIHWIKIPDGYQIAGLEELGLWSTSQLSLWIRSLRQKIGVDFSLSILWGYFSFTNTLCNKNCLLILPLFVAICEIWLPRLIYSVYLVLSLKPGATYCCSGDVLIGSSELWGIVPLVHGVALDPTGVTSGATRWFYAHGA
jgi:hypothetical protein